MSVIVTSAVEQHSEVVRRAHQKWRNSKPPLINTLPVELLSAIFGFAKRSTARVFKQFKHEWCDNETWEEVLWAILAVSHRWRHVAVHTPYLWTEIGYVGKWFVPFRLCVQRSGALPLQVMAEDFLDYDNPKTYLGESEFSPIRDLLEHLSLVNVVHRIQSLRLERSPRFKTIAECLAGHKWPSLKKLSLRGFGPISIPHLFEFLQRCPRLREAYLAHISVRKFRSGDVTTPIILHHLEECEIANVEASIAKTLLKWISAPLLDKLSVGREYHWRSSQLFSLLSHCFGTFSSVRELRFGGHKLHTIEVLDFVAHTANLEALYLFETSQSQQTRDSFVYDDLLDALEGGGNSSRHKLLPLLHTLAFYKMTISSAAVHRFIERRMQSAVPLKNLFLDSETLDNIWRKAEQLRSEVHLDAWFPQFQYWDYEAEHRWFMPLSDLIDRRSFAAPGNEKAVTFWLWHSSDEA